MSNRCYSTLCGVKCWGCERIFCWLSNSETRFWRFPKLWCLKSLKSWNLCRNFPLLSHLTSVCKKSLAWLQSGFSRCAHNSCHWRNLAQIVQAIFVAISIISFLFSILHIMLVVVSCSSNQGNWKNYHPPCTLQKIHFNGQSSQVNHLWWLKYVRTLKPGFSQ